MSRIEKPLESYRDEFPVTDKYIYLDHAGIAPVSIRVKRAVEDFLKGVAEAGAFNYGTWMERVSRIRGRCGKLIGADTESGQPGDDQPV